MAALIPSANASGSGTMTLAGPATSSNQTITIPDATGTMMVSGNMPAFSAYANTSQTITASTFTKVQVNTEEFDTNSYYDNATNYRFTPLIAGYYQVNGQTNGSSTVTLTRIIPAIYKNGSVFKYGTDITATDARSNVSALVYLNGSTDYIEYYVLLNGTGTLSTGITAVLDNYFQAAMIRGA
jgi:hypothetical protein